jgi:hypothetical protein
MTIYAISNDNYITVLDSAEDANSNPEVFNSLEDLTGLAAQWPASRLVEIWNNLPGATPVKKFTDRKKGVNRIWKQILEQSTIASVAPVQDAGEPAATSEAEAAQEPTVAQHAADVAPLETPGPMRPPARNGSEPARPKRRVRAKKARRQS